MSEEIDAKALMEQKDQEFVSRPLVFPMHPDEKNKFYAYRVKFSQEPRSFTSAAGNTYDCADGLLVEAVNSPTFQDKDTKKNKPLVSGDEYTFILHKVLLKKIVELGGGTITGKTFDFAGRGKREPTKGGRPYYDFGVMLKEGTLAWSTLTRVLPIREENE